MQFNEIERNFNSQNLNSNLQRDWLKNTKENVFIWSLAFYALKLIEIANKIGIDQFVCSMRFFWYPYCYGLWHFMPYVIKCQLWHFMTYAIHCCTPYIVAHSSKQSMCVKFDVDTCWCWWFCMTIHWIHDKLDDAQLYLIQFDK